MVPESKYCITRKFSGEFNFTVWLIDTSTAKLKSTTLYQYIMCNIPTGTVHEIKFAKFNSCWIFQLYGIWPKHHKRRGHWSSCRYLLAEPSLRFGWWTHWSYKCLSTHRLVPCLSSVKTQGRTQNLYYFVEGFLISMWWKFMTTPTILWNSACGLACRMLRQW